MSLPRFIVLKSPDAETYLGYKHDNGNYNGYAEFTEPTVVSANAKFEVEIAKDGLVHIRSCTNNKYLERTRNPSITGNPMEEYWITITAKKPEEDQSKKSCTLFKPILEDSVYKNYRFVHVQSGCYLCLWPLATSELSRGVLANNSHVAANQYDIFEFWRRSPNWIWADSDDTEGTDKDTLFRAFKVDNKTIALLNLGNKMFCKRLTDEGKTSCLNAAVPSTTGEAYLRVQEPVLSRTIYNFRYDTENARVYNEQVVLVAKNSATNRTNQANTFDVKLSYTETSTSTWLAHFTLGLEAKVSFQVRVPFISETGVEISSEYETGIEWGETTTTATMMEVNHQVYVKPMTKVTVYLMMSHGMCDVPFVFTQKDTLYNGTVVTTDVIGNTFTGTNYYNIQYETKEEPLSS
ncbi:hypothetical protein PVK06_010173 [Gossypium arboreum]|uniref:Agglutinin domain-containing protein n=1 Tax=Gossypium arboreum TaxID=29729 RepID=A0ABR0QQJ0_GOSAR|nr:hypothetical protein PVK06_010173 [Gossypium arboreum]